MRRAALLAALTLTAACARPPAPPAARPPTQAEQLLRQGYREMMSGRTLDAVGTFDRARAAAPAEPGVRALADAFAATCLLANRRPAEARTRLQRALVDAEEGRAHKAKALALEGLARIELGEGRKEEAARHAAGALGASLRAKDLGGGGIAAELLVAAVGESAAVARPDVLAALREAGRKGAVAAELADLVLRAGTLVAHHAPKRSRVRARIGLRLAEAAGREDLAATALSNLAYHETRRGRLGVARRLLELALGRARRSGDRGAIVGALLNLGLARRKLGEMRSARRLYAEALEMARRVGMAYETGVIVSNLSRLHDAAGDLDRALAGDLEALAIHRRTGPARAVATDLNNLGSIYHRLGRLDDAARAYEEALRLAQAMRDDDLLEAVLLNLGYLEKERGRPKEARRLYVAALAALRRVDKRLYEPAVLSNLAWLDAEAGRCDAAVPRFAEAAAGARAIGGMETAWTALYGQATCVRRSDPAAARRLLDEALGVVERQRASLAGGARGAQAFAAKVHHVYRSAVDLALAAGDGKAAFELAERARARTLVEALAGGRAAERAAPAEMRRWLREASAKVAEAERAVAQASMAGKRAGALQALEAARRRHDELVESVRSQAPSLTGRRNLAELQASLPEDAAVLELVPLSGRVALFVVRRAGFAAVASAVPAQRLRESVEAFRAAMERARSGELAGRWKGPLRSLYAALVAPVRAHLVGAKVLYVVPSGVLNLVPFAALLDGDRPLVEDLAVAVLPAASALTHVRRPLPGGPRVVSVGNPRFASPALPPLPAAEAEARAVAGLFPGGVAWVGAEATEARVKEAAAQADLLHFATHGETNLRAPLFAALHFAPGDGEDGRLEVHELLRLDLRAALVVLSACQTAVQSGLRGALPAGEEFIGLVAALLEAGSAAVVASLWPVADESTSALMQAFYRALPTEGRAQALRAAQRALRARSPHPFFWAPFVLVGDGG